MWKVVYSLLCPFVQLLEPQSNQPYIMNYPIFQRGAISCQIYYIFLLASTYARNSLNILNIRRHYNIFSKKLNEDTPSGIYSFCTRQQAGVYT